MGFIDKLKDKAQVISGKVEERLGKATHDRSMEAEGRGDQVAGNLKQAGEKAKDAFRP